MESNSVDEIKLDVVDTTELLPLINEYISNDSCNVIFIATDKILELAELDEELKHNLTLADAVFSSANIKIQDSEENMLKELDTKGDLSSDSLDNRKNEENNEIYCIDERLVSEITNDTEIENPSIMIMSDDVGFIEVIRNKGEGLSELVDFIGEYIFEDEIDDDLVINEINANLPDILLCSFESPLQEKWLVENRSKMNVKLCLGLSGEVGNSVLKKENRLRWITRLFTRTQSLF